MLPTTSAGTRQSEAGFTLIELSIVLIIIGLLIGGVLQGQEMINNTRLKTTVSQTDSIQAAVQTFQDKFNELPGDFAQAAVIAAGNVPGDDDGIIDFAAANAAVVLNTATATGTEAANVFDHLQDANLLQGVRDGGAAGNPIWVLDTQIDGGVFDVGTLIFAAGNGVGIRMSAGTGATNALLAPVDAFSLDTKYDDGNPLTGRWESPTAATDTAANSCHTAGAWTAGTVPGCFTAISIR